MNRVALMMVCCVPFVLGASSAARADVVDMSKFTCESLLQASGNSIEAAVWLSGYYNGTRKNTKLDLAQFHQNAEVIVAECRENPKATVMGTIGKMMSRKK
jgi:hypothetical protein